MGEKEYLEKRNGLINEAETLMQEQKIDLANTKMGEVEALDKKWDDFKLANANMQALKDNSKVADLSNFSVKENEMLNTKKVENINNLENNVKPNDDSVYLNAWAKEMMGVSLSNSEKEIFTKVNSKFKNDFNTVYTHTTVNTPTLIPETVVAGIWKRAEEMYPMINDITRYNVTGTLTINKHVSIDAGDADWYSDGVQTNDEQNTFGQLTLTGCELAKAITVSWKLKAMAVSDFIPFIERELGERLGVVLGKALYSGSGVAGQQPQGILTALAAEASTPQKITYTDDQGVDPLNYKKLTKAMEKIHSSYASGVVIYANNATIWNRLANILDEMGRPLFIPDVTGNGVGRIFGLQVKADAGIGNDNILFGNARQGYVFNTNEPLSLATEDHVKTRETDYAAYTIVDGKVMDTKAFAYLTLA